MLGDVVFLTISIHAPREGVRLLIGVYSLGLRSISIHAPREGVRPLADRKKEEQAYFNPRTPRGVRPGGWVWCSPRRAEFQSTHPARGATTRTSTAQANVRFQSTHPARGATAHKRDHARRILYFNPRTPRGVRLTLPTARAPQNTISIHAPREGCDQDIHHCCVTCTFQSTHPARGATRCSRRMFGHPVQFQSTHPARGATFVCVGV